MAVRRGDKKRPIQQIEDTKGVDSEIRHKEPIEVQSDPKIEEISKEVEKKNAFLPRRFYNKPKHLPSKGLGYPKGWSISLRSYAYGEIEKVMQSQSVVEVYELALAGMETVGFDKLDLTMQDFLYLMLNRRIIAMSASRLQVATICPLCGNKNSSIYSTDEFGFDDIKVPSLPIIVDFSDREARFMPMTIGAWLTVLKAKEGDLVSKVEFQALQMNLGTPDMDFEECYDFLFNLEDAEDSAIPDKVDSLLYHGAKLFEFICSAKVQGDTDESLETCGFTYRVKSASILEAFVTPFRDEQYKRNVESKIRFS